MTDNGSDKTRALMKLGAAIFGRNNLISTDFGDIRARRIDRKFIKGGLVQDDAGVRIVFSISNHALGKIIGSSQDADALDCLLAENSEVSVENTQN